MKSNYLFSALSLIISTFIIPGTVLGATTVGEYTFTGGTDSATVYDPLFDFQDFNGSGLNYPGGEVLINGNVTGANNYGGFNLTNNTSMGLSELIFDFTVESDQQLTIAYTRQGESGVWTMLADGLTGSATNYSISLLGIDPPAGNWIHFRFWETGDNTDGVFLDNIRVTAVPVPAAAWLFGSALLGLVAVGKRRKS